MSADEHAPFRRDGGQVPVRYVVAPVEEGPPAERQPPDRSALQRRVAVVTALALVVALVAVGERFLGVQPEGRGPSLVAGLDEPPKVPHHEAVGTFLAARGTDFSADVSLGGKSVTVRAAERATGRLLWEEELGVPHPVSSLLLVDNRASGALIVVMSPPWRTVSAQHQRGGVYATELQAPLTNTVAALDRVTGEERLRSEWPSEALPVSSDGGGLYRWDRGASTLSALKDVETVLWETPIDDGGPTTSGIGLREHSGWLLVVPSEQDRRSRFRGSDVFLTALEPATGESAAWLDDFPGRYQRVILDDAFVEVTVGAGERVVRARRWSDGERLWQRFDDAVNIAALGDRLYFTAAHPDGTRLSRHSVKDGSESWELVLAGTPGIFAAGEEELFVTVREGYALSVIDPEAGSIVRTLSYAPPDGVDDVQFDDAASPFLGVDKYFVQQAEYDGVRILARALDDGRVLWEKSFPGFHEASQMDDRLVLRDINAARVAPM